MFIVWLINNSFWDVTCNNSHGKEESQGFEKKEKRRGKKLSKAEKENN